MLKWFDHVEKKTSEVFPDGVEEQNLGEGIRNLVYSPRGTYIAVCERSGIRLLNANTL